MNLANSHIPSPRRLILTAVLALIISAPLAKGQFVIETNSGAITLIQWTEPAEVVYIPDTIFDMPVTGIADGAFSQEDVLKYVTIPDTVTNIGAFAFFGCTSLSGVSMPAGLVTIGSQAFQHSALTKVMFGNSLLTIGEGAFDDCTNLTSIKIPDQVITLGRIAFADCSSLTNATIGKGVTISLVKLS